MSIAVIKKRDGRIVPFDVKKISDAIEKSFRADAEQEDRRDLSDNLAWEVTTRLQQEDNPAPTVERVQDLVEQVLKDRGYLQTAKRFVLYRQARTAARSLGDQGRGAVELESWEPTLTGQAVAICAAIRNNGGADRLIGFYESLAPAVENRLTHSYEACLRLALALTTGNRVAPQTLKSIRLALKAAGLSLLGPDRDSCLARQADLLCGTLGCDRHPVERAQQEAFETALSQTREAIGQTLLCLQARGCTRELIAPPEERTPAVELLLAVDEGERK